MGKRRSSCVRAVALAIAVGGWAWPAVDARADGAAADALFAEGKRLMEQEDFEEACSKFEASYNLDRTLGTLLNLANCNEARGRIATAWAEWGEAAELARRSRDDRVGFAEDRRSDLTDRLPMLTVTVDRPVASLKVRRGSDTLPEGTYGVALPVDPGSHVLQVVRGEQVLKQEVVSLKEKERAEVRFDMQAIDASVPPEAPPPAAPVVSTRIEGGGYSPSDGSTQRTVGFVVGGVGVASLVVAGVFGILTLSKKGTADSPDACIGEDEKLCTPAGLDAADTAKTFANVTQWVGIGGLVVTAIGVTLVLTAPDASSALEQRAERRPPPRRLWASPWGGPAGGGLSAGGNF